MKRLFWRIYLYFGVVLVALSIFVSLVYTQLNRSNIIEVYQKQLEVWAENICIQVEDYVQHEDVDGFSSYLSAIEDFGKMEKIDIWIMSNLNKKNGMNSQFTNIELREVELPQKTNKIINDAYKGKKGSYQDFDSIYEKTMLHFTSPIKNSEGVIGVVLLNMTVEGQEETISQYQNYLVISILVGLLASIFLVTFFTNQISKPIFKMKKLALELAAGNYIKKTEINRKDEIGDLANSLDILSEKLSEAEKMRNNMEQNRRDFFSSVSHELRTPITVMKGYTETLVDGYVLEEEKRQDYLLRILRECTGMERLVSDLLVLSKIQNPDFPLNKEIINVIAVMQDILRSMRVILNEKEMKVKFDYEDEVSFIFGDYDRIRQLFMVLIQNAIKYSPKGNGEQEFAVEIFIGKKDGNIITKITDHGIGIPKEQLEHIFEKFVQGDNHIVKDGSGLGLVVARGIAERHDGTIHATSILGKETCFTVIIQEASPPEI